jgi:hypothetical protein
MDLALIVCSSQRIPSPDFCILSSVLGSSASRLLPFAPELLQLLNRNSSLPSPPGPLLKMPA